jgi:uncharacterized delta-60 repeat protein
MSVAVIVLTATTLGVAGVPDGSLDLTFGVGGRVTTEDPTPFASAQASAIQADGKIHCSRHSHPSQRVRFRLSPSALQPGGSVEPTFGMQGSVTTSFSERDDVATALALQSDGKIIAAGTGHVIDDLRPRLYGVVVRYNQDGSVDTTFGERGKVTTDVLDSSDINALAL